MGNKFYQPGECRAEKVEDLFAAIAPRYDLINDLQSLGLHRGWKRRMVALSEANPGVTALDLCCGTGDVAFRLAVRGARVAGLDFSGPMLSVAALRAAAIGQASGTMPPLFLRGDAQRIPFPEATFDVVTISYGLRNLADLDRGLGEMWRVLRPGGRLLILDFGRPDNRVWRALYFAYLRWLVPVFGRVFCGDSATHAYILESLLHYPAQRGVAARLEGMGCVEVRLFNLLGGMMSINTARKPGAAFKAPTA